MSWSAPLGEGDWIRTRRRLPVTLTDALGGGTSGLAAGTLGVIVTRHGRHLTVDFDAGWGIVRATVSLADCRLARRGGGVGTFRRRAGRLTVARIAVAVALALPVLQFAAEYAWTRHTLDGMVQALAAGTAYGVVDAVEAALNQPVKALCYALVVGALSRFAFGSS